MLKIGAPKTGRPETTSFSSERLSSSQQLSWLRSSLFDSPYSNLRFKKSQRDSYIESVHSNVKKKMHLKFIRAIIRSLFPLRITLQKTYRRIDVTRCRRPSPNSRSRAKHAWGKLLGQASRMFRPRGSREDRRQSRPPFAMLVKGRFKNERWKKDLFDFIA